MSGKIETNEEAMLAMAKGYACIAEELQQMEVELYRMNFDILQEWKGMSADVFAQAGYECEMQLQDAAKKMEASGEIIARTAEERVELDASLIP